MRRVRFDTELAPDESIPGALARAVTSHVLYRTRPVLQAAGINITYPGHVQILEREQLANLAHVIRCDPIRLDAIRGQRIMTRECGITHQRVHFGDLHMLRSHMDLNRRRISPLSLQHSDHHRLSWLNNLLQYCPVSFEKLIDRCPACEKSLGWRMTWGIGICEHCERVIPPSAAAPLPQHMKSDYLLFARLCSPAPGEWAAARRELPETLLGIGSATLIRLALRIGFLAQLPMVVNVRMHAASELPVEVLTNVVTDGARMLRTWPTGFVEWAHLRANELRHDHSSFLGFRIALRRLAFAPLEGEEQSALVTAALPDLRRAFEHAFSSEEGIYLQNEAARKIGISSTKLRDVRDAGFIGHVTLPGRSRLRVQYPISVIDRLAELVRSTPMISHFPGKFGLPTYAIEQLICDGVLSRETDGALNAIREIVCVRPASVDTFVAHMNEVARTDEPPTTAIPLRAAARRIGGRLKPWSQIVLALARAEIPIWRATGCFQARQWLVRPDDLLVFDHVLAVDTTAISNNWINLDDLGELLNITPKMIQPVATDFRLSIVERGRANCVALTTALDIAGKMSTTAEVGAQLRMHSKAADHMMRRQGIKAISVGWCRRDLVDRGHLPH